MYHLNNNLEIGVPMYVHTYTNYVYYQFEVVIESLNTQTKERQNI